MVTYESDALVLDSPRGEMMARNYLHWCPNGCGKCVVYGGSVGVNPTKEKPFACERCLNLFSKKEIEEA